MVLEYWSIIMERKIVFAGAAAERAVGLDAFEHGAHDFIDEDGFEILRRLARLVAFFAEGGGNAGLAKDSAEESCRSPSPPKSLIRSPGFRLAARPPP